MNPRVSAQFTGHGARVLHALEEETGRRFHFDGSEGLPLDHFAVTSRARREEVEERAVPFRAGDEVLVEIVEPHMYVGRRRRREDRRLHHLACAAAAASSARSCSCASRRPAARRRSRSPIDEPALVRGRPSARWRRIRRLGAVAAEADGAVRLTRSRPPKSWPVPDSSAPHDHVRDRQDRRQAVPRRAGADPAGRAPARGRGRDRRARADPVPLRRRRLRRRRRSRRSRSRRRSSATCAARSCACSSSSPSAATSAAPATARS